MCDILANKCNSKVKDLKADLNFGSKRRDSTLRGDAFQDKYMFFVELTQVGSNSLILNV